MIQFAADDEQRGSGGVAREIHGGLEDGHRAQPAEVRREQIAVERVERVEGRLLAREELHDGHAERSR